MYYYERPLSLRTIKDLSRLSYGGYYGAIAYYYIATTIIQLFSKLERILYKGVR